MIQRHRKGPVNDSETYERAFAEPFLLKRAPSQGVGCKCTAF